MSEMGVLQPRVLLLVLMKELSCSHENTIIDVGAVMLKLSLLQGGEEQCDISLNVMKYPFVDLTAMSVASKVQI